MKGGVYRMLTKQGTEEEREQARNRRESPDHSGVSPSLFALRGRLHPGDGRLRHGER